MDASEVVSGRTSECAVLDLLEVEAGGLMDTGTIDTLVTSNVRSCVPWTSSVIRRRTDGRTDVFRSRGGDDPMSSSSRCGGAQRWSGGAPIRPRVFRGALPSEPREGVVSRRQGSICGALRDGCPRRAQSRTRRGKEVRDFPRSIPTERPVLARRLDCGKGGITGTAPCAGTLRGQVALQSHDALPVPRADCFSVRLRVYQKQACGLTMIRQALEIAQRQGETIAFSMRTCER